MTARWRDARGDKLYHEHACVLVQIGLLDLADLPVTGVEAARKLVDETRPSNTLMQRWAESAGRPSSPNFTPGKRR